MDKPPYSYVLWSTVKLPRESCTNMTRPDDRKRYFIAVIGEVIMAVRH